MIRTEPSPSPTKARVWIILAAAVSAVALASCDAPNNNSPQQIMVGQLRTYYNACLAEQQDPHFASIRGRVASKGQPTYEQMADNGRPSASERPLLIEWAHLADDCHTRLENLSEAEGTIVIGDWSQYQIALATLASGGSTYAEYNRTMASLSGAARGQANAMMAADRAQTPPDSADAALVRMGYGIDATLTNALYHRLLR